MEKRVHGRHTCYCGFHSTSYFDRMNGAHPASGGSFSVHFERPRVIRIRRSRLAVRHSKRERRCDSSSRMGRAIAAVCRGGIEKHCKTKEIRAAGRIWTVVMKLEPDRFVRTFLSGSDKSVRVGSAAGSFCVHGKSPALLSKRDSYKPSVSIQRWVAELESSPNPRP